MVRLYYHRYNFEKKINSCSTYQLKMFFVSCEVYQAGTKGFHSFLSGLGFICTNGNIIVAPTKTSKFKLVNLHDCFMQNIKKAAYLIDTSGS